MSSTDDSPLRVNDPVHVERESSQQLEGVVAYVGQVDFSEGDDWVGVRLTGASIGLGKNDGSVNGVPYFTCGPNSGVFVRNHAVSRRTLTRLEELRLKRELAKDGPSIAPPRADVVGTKNRTPAKTTTSRAVPTRTTPTPVVPSFSAKSRLDEIRERRAALVDKQSAPSSAASSRAPSRSSSPTIKVKTKSPVKSSREQKDVDEKDSDDGVDEVVEQDGENARFEQLQQQFHEISENLRAKEQENAALQQALSKAEQDAHEANLAREELVQHASEARETTESPSHFEDQEQVQMALQQAQQDRQDLEERLQQLQHDLSVVSRDYERERKERAAEKSQLNQVRSEFAALQHEWNATQDQAVHRGASDASHYKERAKLQAELGAMKRRVQELEKEKIETESTLEELALDKEQLQEEKESLQDRLEELKIDAETAQMEVEELRMELEDAKSATSAGSGGVSAAVDSNGADADDVVQAMSVQNARLREALIRLRENASMEKMELTRQLRAAEKEAAVGTGTTKELETLRKAKATLEEQLREMSEMVEQGSFFESMVESLSDRVLALEDDNVALQSTIRELEEAADITAEMEEVQADENKTLMRDLESRDSIIRNLEEAIKMQRRREEDFQRTVGNYRRTVETLKQEKANLLAMQRGGEGEKSDLLATSQKALARAAQLVSDAASARKLEAQAAFDGIEADAQRHKSERLESFLPQRVFSSELSSIRGELLLSKLVSKASKSLEGMATVFGNIVRTAAGEVLTFGEDTEDFTQKVHLSDEASQSLANMMHQSEFALATVNISADLLRILSAGQWPDLLSTGASAELGAWVGHSVSDLDVALGDVLKTLKEEGILSHHRSNIGAFQQSVQTAMRILNSASDEKGSMLIPSDWRPPAWELFRNVSLAKFACLGAGAAVASILNPDDPFQSSNDSSPVSNEAKLMLKSLMTKLERICAEFSKVHPRLSRLDVKDEKLVTELSGLAAAWNVGSNDLLGAVRKAFSSTTDFDRNVIANCESAADVVIQVAIQFSSSMRAANLVSEVEAAFHPLSPEANDPWQGITTLAKMVRSIDGDRDDVNYLARARTLEHRIVDAIDSEAKLSVATMKLASLEKSLSSRSKEVAMQNARLSELEKLLAKASVTAPARGTKSPELSSIEEMNVLKEENRVLTEAMEVLQRQVDEYEREIRWLKDSKSPPSGQRASRTPRRSASLISEPEKRRAAVDFQGEPDTSSGTPGSIDAALLRPVLQSAMQEAASWKARAVHTSLLSLPPLQGIGGLYEHDMRLTGSFGEESKEQDPEHHTLSSSAHLHAARSLLRIEKASISIIDITRSTSKMNNRLCVLEERVKMTKAEGNLERATRDADLRLAVATGASTSSERTMQSRKFVGRIKTEGTATSSVIPISLNATDLHRLHMHMLQ